MNHSFYSVDRTTHFKVVAVALIGATAVAWISIASHFSGGIASTQAEHVRVIKAGQPAAVAANTRFVVR
jgi:hypothetical protein